MTLRATRAACAAVALFAVAAIARCTAGGAPAGGPLVAPPPHGFAMSKPVGFVFTDGVETLELSGRKPAVLKKVEVVGNPALRIVGVALVKPGRKVGTIQEIDGWPPRDQYLRPSDVINPGIGATFTPKRQNPQTQSYELLVGMRVAKPGYLVRDGLRITNEVDGKTYQRLFPAQLVVCTARKFEKPGEGCTPPPGSGS